MGKIKIVRLTTNLYTSLRFFSPNYSAITNAGLLLFGNEVERYIPGAYIQYVKFDGLTEADDPINEKKFSGNLVHILSELDSFLEYAIVQQKPVPVTTLKEKKQFNFPKWAIRELLMNSVMHRDYESNAPIKFYQYKDRIEIINPGGLYGNARPENFPNVNDYRNPVIAEAMKVLGYVNRFNRGIARVKKELADNGNSEAIFDYKKIGMFGVTVFDALYKLTVPEDIVHESGETVKLPSEKSSQKGSQKSSQKILQLVQENSVITTTEMADKLNITRRAIAKQIEKLKREGKLKRIGPDKGGRWEISR